MDSHQQPLTPYEQRLRDEVIYLHSLWHRGPPPSSIPNPNPYSPNIPPHYTSNPTRNLHVFNPPSFKKTNRNPHQNSRKFTLSSSKPDALPDPGPEWPVDPPPRSSPPASPAWTSFEEKPTAETRKLSDIDESKVAMVRLQQNVMKICDDFFAKRVDSDGDEDDEFFGENGEDDSFAIEESEEFKFFFSLFVENREMRDFYENNQDSGGFYCLVCRGVGKPGGKLFKDCQGLVQHANRILKTKRRRAHRAFGLTICRLLGWDISRLPVIVLKGQPLSQSLASLGETLNHVKEDDSRKVVEDIDDGACVTQEKKVVDIVENCLKEEEDDSEKEVEDIESGACVAQESKVVDIVEGEPKANDDNGEEAPEHAKD